MSEPEAPTPYAEAAALKSAGAEADTIAARLKVRGLDDEAIALLLNAVGARTLTGPLPTSAPIVEAPVAAPADPLVPALGPPPSTVCARCGVFLDAWVPALARSATARSSSAGSPCSPA